MRLLSRLETIGALVVAAISGDVYGGGCEVIAACDVRVVEERAQLAFRQTRIGVGALPAPTMAARSAAGNCRHRRTLPGAARSAYLGRPIPVLRKPIHQKSAPGSGGVSALFNLGLVVGPLSAAPKHLVHRRLLFLEHERVRFSSHQCALARRQRRLALFSSSTTIHLTLRVAASAVGPCSRAKADAMDIAWRLYGRAALDSASGSQRGS